MKLKNFSLLMGIGFLLVSCTSTKNVQPASLKSKSENLAGELKQKTPQEVFVEENAGLELKITEAPKTVNFNRKFSSPFSVTVTKDGNPVFEYPLLVKYPVSKNNQTYVTNQVIIKTNEQGLASFRPEKNNFSAKTFVKFSPYTELEGKEVSDFINSKTVSIPWNVRSDIVTKGAVLFVYDYDEKEYPTKNSYEILSELREYTTLAGNAPTSDPSYLGYSLEKLYKENYEIIGTDFGYLVCGSIKFEKPVEKIDEEYVCSLIADIQVLRMSDGKLVFNKKFKHDKKASNWNKCTTSCKNELAKKIVDEIVYGL